MPNSALSPSLDGDFPPLDLHAHIDPTVTQSQLGTLGTALVFAVTRTLTESETVASRQDRRIIWGAGAHPGRPDAVASYAEDRYRAALRAVGFAGEIGLDRKVSNGRAVAVFGDALAAAREVGVLASVHSSGRQKQVLETLDGDASGVILHWFTGPRRLVDEAADAGAFFSINVAMSDEQIITLPPERLLPETDFPYTKRAGSGLPGDIDLLETRCATLLGRSRNEVRLAWYRNLRDAYRTGGCTGSIPAVLAVPLAAA